MAALKRRPAAATAAGAVMWPPSPSRCCAPLRPAAPTAAGAAAPSAGAAGAAAAPAPCSPASPCSCPCPRCRPSFRPCQAAPPRPLRRLWRQWRWVHNALQATWCSARWDARSSGGYSQAQARVNVYTHTHTSTCDYMYPFGAHGCSPPVEGRRCGGCGCSWCTAHVQASVCLLLGSCLPLGRITGRAITYAHRVAESSVYTRSVFAKFCASLPEHAGHSYGFQQPYLHMSTRALMCLLAPLCGCAGRHSHAWRTHTQTHARRCPSAGR